MFKIMNISKDDVSEFRRVYRDVLLTSCLEIIKYLESKKERFATMTDIAEATGYSLRTIVERVKLLEKHGIVSTRKTAIKSKVYNVVRLEVNGIVILFAEQ